MALGWQSKLARFSRMDWDEVRVRAGQEFHKRCDLLMYRMGGRRETIRLNRDSAEQRGPLFFSGRFSGRRMRSAGIVFVCWVMKTLTSVLTQLGVGKTATEISRRSTGILIR